MKESCKICQKYACMVTFIAKPQNGYKAHQGVKWKIICIPIISYKMFFLKTPISLVGNLSNIQEQLILVANEIIWKKIGWISPFSTVSVRLKIIGFFLWLELPTGLPCQVLRSTRIIKPSLTNQKPYIEAYSILNTFLLVWNKFCTLVGCMPFLLFILL